MLPKDDRATSGKRLTFIFNAGRRLRRKSEAGLDKERW
jgi:hypothetical protein